MRYCVRERLGRVGRVGLDAGERRGVGGRPAHGRRDVEVVEKHIARGGKRSIGVERRIGERQLVAAAAEDAHRHRSAQQRGSNPREGDASHVDPVDPGRHVMLVLGQTDESNQDRRRAATSLGQLRQIEAVRRSGSHPACGQVDPSPVSVSQAHGIRVRNEGQGVARVAFDPGVAGRAGSELLVSLTSGAKTVAAPGQARRDSPRSNRSRAASP